jgi:glutamyl-tRNA synthetase
VSNVRVRFAPSPTGKVHIGNIRVAIFNWLFARHEGGKFLLRIEDTDHERSTKETIDALFDVMSWLGLDYDEEPLYQSSRRDAHLAVAEEFLQKGLAYKEDKGGTGQGECIVFRMPDEDMMFHDEVKGDLCKKAEDLKDFVIVRSDGTPLFHLANIMDDIEMGITHIIRGDDHIENTYRHVAVYKALGLDPPKYVHLPMVVNQQGKPYAKRDGDCFVGEFRDKGFHPDGLFNYLALLGWSPGDDREKMTREEMIEAFSLERVKSGAGQMDIKKMTHMNAEYISDLPLSEFIEVARSFVSNCDWGLELDDGDFKKVCELMQTRTHLYVSVEGWKYFFSDDIDYDEKAVRKNLKKDGVKESIVALVPMLQDLEFTEAGVEKALRDAEKSGGIKEGKLNQAVRIAVTGTPVGAGIYDTMMLLGKDTCVKRLQHTIASLLGDSPDE